MSLHKMLAKAVRRELGLADWTVLVCERDWEAWSFGTMTSDDFHNACEDDDLIEDLVDRLIPVVQQEIGRRRRDNRFTQEEWDALAGAAATSDEFGLSTMRSAMRKIQAAGLIPDGEENWWD